MRLNYKHITSLLSIVFTVLCVQKASANTQTIMVGGPSGMSFVPASGVSINMGDTIKFQWQNGSHTTTSTTIPAGAASWNQSINSGSTTYTYVPTVAGTYNYKCIPHESMGMVASFNVVCTAPVTPGVTPLGPVTACRGAAAGTLSAEAGSGITFQWYKNGNLISGATNAQYLPDSSGTYTCKVTNGCGNATSNAVTVTINPSPQPSFTFSNVQMAYTFTNTTIGSGLHWNWDFGDAATSTDQSPQHTYATSGAYSVHLTATDSFGAQCSAMAMQTVTVGSTAINNVNSNTLNFKVSPNPASKEITVTYKQGNATFRMYDMEGRNVAIPNITNKSNTSATIDISNLSSGNYILELKLDDQSATKRISIRR